MDNVMVFVHCRSQMSSKRHLSVFQTRKALYWLFLGVIQTWPWLERAVIFICAQAELPVKNSIYYNVCTHIYKNILDFIKQAYTATCLPIGLCTNKTTQISCCKPNKHGYTTVQTTAIYTKMDTNLFSAHQDKWKDLLRTYRAWFWRYCAWESREIMSCHSQ